MAIGARTLVRRGPGLVRAGVMGRAVVASSGNKNCHLERRSPGDPLGTTEVERSAVAFRPLLKGKKA